jgi:hypothetical protein
LRKFLLLFLASIAASVASAQTMPPPFIESIDLTVLNAKSVVVGTVSEFTETHNENLGLGYDPSQVTVTVLETLKGDPHTQIRLMFGQTPEELAHWKAKATRLLIFPPPASTDWRIELIDLDAPDLRVSDAYFHAMRTPDRVLEYIREFVRRNPGVTWKNGFRLAPPDNDVGKRWREEMGAANEKLSVPVDKRLEEIALKQIRSNDLNERARGADSLRDFKSDANIARLKALLADPGFVVATSSEDHKPVTVRLYQVRSAAYQVLQAWQVRVDEPVTREEIAN